MEQEIGKAVDTEERAAVFDSWLLRFGDELRRRGYTAGSIDNYLRHCRRLCRYLVQRGVDVSTLTSEELEEYVDMYARAGEGQAAPEVKARRAGSPGRLFLAYLRQQGASPEGAEMQEEESPVLADYLEFLHKHRGLSRRTIDRHQRYVRRFLSHAGVNAAGDFATVSIKSIDHFLVDTGRYMARRSMAGVSSALRGFLGYVHMRGLLPQNLKMQVMTPRIHELETVQRALAWSEVQRLLDSVDRSTTRGRRNYAVLLLLAICGLRAGEVVQLRLDDIDWRHDAIRVYRSKTDTADRIPLVPDVGEALVAYLRHRPAFSSCMEIFVTARAPYRALYSSTLHNIVDEAMTVAGIEAPHRGPHTLRHSYAVHLLRQGLSLKAIGDTMGHRHPRSTFAYTKASTEDLREVALDVREVLP